MDQTELGLNESIEASVEQKSDNEYTSEIFKLEVKNLPSNFGFGVY